MYVLSMFLSFRETGCGFLIPAFSQKDSNQSFSHEVGPDGRILRFNKIHTEMYFKDCDLYKGTIRDVGGYAVFAVRLKNDQVFHGNYDEIKFLLSAIDLDELGSPFFNVDAYSFIGDNVKRQKAIRTAAELFANRKIGRIWKGMESRVKVLGMERVTIFEEKGVAPPDDGHQNKGHEPAHDASLRRIATLIQRHSQLGIEIERLQNRPSTDYVALQNLKRRRLVMKDIIYRWGRRID